MKTQDTEYNKCLVCACEYVVPRSLKTTLLEIFRNMYFTLGLVWCKDVKRSRDKALPCLVTNLNHPKLMFFLLQELKNGEVCIVCATPTPKKLKNTRSISNKLICFCVKDLDTRCEQFRAHRSCEITLPFNWCIFDLCWSSKWRPYNFYINQIKCCIFCISLERGNSSCCPRMCESTWTINSVVCLWFCFYRLSKAKS